MDYSTTIVKLLVLATTAQLIAGLGCRRVVQADPMTATPSVEKTAAPAAPMKRSPAEHEMTLDELTDIRPENIPPGAPCVFVNGKLRCTWCDVEIKRQPPRPQSCPP
jgi:hypothetical protein